MSISYRYYTITWTKSRNRMVNSKSNRMAIKHRQIVVENKQRKIWEKSKCAYELHTTRSSHCGYCFVRVCALHNSAFICNRTAAANLFANDGKECLFFGFRSCCETIFAQKRLRFRRNKINFSLCLFFLPAAVNGFAVSLVQIRLKNILSHLFDTTTQISYAL